MPFVKGAPRHQNAGRKKGTPNKATKISDFLIENKIDIFGEIWARYNELTENRDKLFYLFKILEYIQPKAQPDQTNLHVSMATEVSEETVNKMYEIVRAAG